MVSSAHGVVFQQNPGHHGKAGTGTGRADLGTVNNPRWKHSQQQELHPRKEWVQSAGKENSAWCRTVGVGQDAGNWPAAKVL